MKKIACSLLLLICLCVGAAERKNTDVVIIIKVPRDTTTSPTVIDLLRPADITALRKESWNIYLPDTDEFLCVMTVAAEDEGKMLDTIRAYEAKVVEEITPLKEVIMQALAPTFLTVKANVEEAVEFAGETEAEYKARRGN